MTQGAYVEAIYWGTRWANSAFVGDKRTGLLSFYSGFGGSSYEATNSEFSDATGHVGTSVTVGVDHVDLLPAAPKNGNHTSTILEEVCSQATSLMTDGYYPVYIDSLAAIPVIAPGTAPAPARTV